MKLLQIDSSPRLENSISRLLTDAVAHAWMACFPQGQIVRRDVGLAPPTHLAGDLLACLKHGQPAGEGPALVAELALTQTLIDELFEADAVVIGAPMYNHGVTSQLKAWIDRVSVAGRTFRYTAAEPVGLVPDKPVIIASTRGGIYSTPEKRHEDYQEPYLASILGLLGLRSVQVIRAEGVDMGADLRVLALAQAEVQIDAAVRDIARQLPLVA